jgi:hypothetical protein
LALFRPDADEDDIAAWAEKAFDSMHTARLTLERKWLVNLSFYYGNQWVVWGPVVQNSRRLEDPKNAPPWRVRLTVNKIQPYVRREMARLSSAKPRGHVLPASQDENDRHAARTAISVLDYLHEELDVDAAHDLADWWVSIVGSAFYKVRWTEDIDPETRKPGILKLDVIRPFDIYVPDLEETRIKEQEYLCQAQAMRVAEIAEIWGVDVTPDEYTSEIDQKVRSQMSVFSGEKGEDWAVVKEFWIKPCRRYPNGLVLATANGKLLPYKTEDPEEQLLQGELGEEAPTLGETDFNVLNEEGMAGTDLNDAKYEKTSANVPAGTIEWPFGHGRLPFVPRGHTKSGRFYDSSFVDQLISLQREYNRSRSQVVENKNLTSRPQWAVPLGSVDRADLTTEPGAVIFYSPGFASPEPIKTPQLPNYVIEHIKLTAQEMDEIASQNEVSKGNVPPNVEAATAIAYLQEKDESAVAYAVRSKERAIQEIGQQLLKLVREFWDEERLIRVVGRNDVFNAMTFVGSDLRENTDYRVIPGSGLPRSKAAQEAKIMEMAQSGMLPVANALKLLDMPDIAAVVADVEVDVIEADKENLVMSQGEYAPVEIWQDHVAHIDEHDAFKKREEYKHLDQEIWKIFRFHDYTHLQQLALLFNIPVPPPMPDPNTIDPMTGAPAVDPMTGQPVPQDPLYVDPAHEFALRAVFIQLKAGGAPPPATTAAGAPAPGEEEVPV